MEMKESSDGKTIDQTMIKNSVIILKEDLSEATLTTATERLTCNLCNQIFSHISNLRRHVRRQHDRGGEKPRARVTRAKDDTKVDTASKYVCKTCNQTFSDKSNLRRHEKRQHEEVQEGNYKCKLCMKTFTRQGNLSRHLVNCGTDRKCKHCNITFACAQNLRRHNKKQHQIDFMLANGTCDKAEDAVDEDEENEKKFSNTLGFECPSCSKVFTNQSSLNGHRRFCNQTCENSKTYCIHCKKHFFDASTLVKHVKRKHSEHTEGENHFESTKNNSVAINSSSAFSGAIADDDNKDCEYLLDSGKELGKENADALTDTSRHNAEALIDSTQHNEIKDGMKKCSNCRKEFTRLSDLSKHLKSGCTALTCTVCNIKYSCLSNLRRHLKKSHKLDTIEDEDDRSQAVLDAQNAAESKPDTKLDVLQCKICKLSFPNNIAFGLHSRTHNPLRTCLKCDKTFKAGSEWLEHVKFHRQKKKEMEDKKYCHICGKSFLSYGGFYKHMRCHAGYKVSCKICLKTFSAVQSLKIHMRSHKGEKPYQCEICGSRFAQQSHLKRHLDSHEGKRKFQCLMCDKSFMDSSGLRAHERSHTGFKPYECNICSYKTTMASSLSTHKKIHSMKRDFKCKICERTFTQKHSLLRHVVKHENDSSSIKPGFVTKPTLFCSQCPKGFTTKRGLTRHIQKHTKGLIRNVIRREVDNGDGQNSEKVTALISSVHGHYQSGNNSKCADTAVQSHDTEPAETANLNGNYSKCAPETSLSTEIVVERGPLVQNINTSQTSNFTQALNSCSDANEMSASLKPSYILKDNELSRNTSQMSSNKETSQNVILTYYDFQSQEGNRVGYIQIEKPVNHFTDNNVASSPNYGVEIDSALNKGTKAEEVNRSSSMAIPQHQNIVVSKPMENYSNDPEERSDSADGLNTLSNVVCNLEDGTISGWESFRFSEPIDGCDRDTHTDHNTRHIESDTSHTVHQSKEELDKESQSYHHEKSVISDEEPTFVDPETAHNNNAVIKSIDESYQNQSSDARPELSVSPQSHQLLHKTNDDVENKEIVEDDIVKEDDFITVIKLKSQSEGTRLVCNICSLSFENEILLTRHKERLHSEETKMKETENVAKSKDLSCKVQCLKCYTKFNSFLKFKKHIKRECVGKQTKPSLVLQTTEGNGCKIENADSDTNETIIVIKKEDIQNEKFDNGGKESKEKKCKFACSYCDKNFSFLNSLKFHERKHREPASHICEICGRGFYKPYYLKRHLALHENKTKETCFCNKCGKMFQKEAALITHMRVHMGLDPFPCTLCDKSFTHSSNLKRHMKSHVNGKEDTEVVHSYYCHLCGKGYTAKASLQVHLNTHSGVKPHQCPHCEATFTQSSHLRRHIKSHSGERSVKCEVCQKMFFDTSTMKIHLRSHSGERPYSCKICGHSFSQLQNLRVHEGKHNGLKKFKCNICLQEFTTKMSLDRHWKRHEREGALDPEMKSKRYMTVKKMKDKVVPCPDCDRHFTTRKSMLAHRRQTCYRGLEPTSVAAGSITEAENTEILDSSSDRLEKVEQMDTNEEIGKKADNRHDLETDETEVVEPLSLVKEKISRDKIPCGNPNAVEHKYEESKTAELSEEINEEIYAVKQLPDKQIVKDVVTFQQDASDTRQPYTETKPYDKVQETELAAKNYTYPSRTVIFYNEQRANLATRQENEAHAQPRISQEEARISSSKEQYNSARNSFKQANKIKHSGRNFIDNAPVERQIHESVDNIADSMVSFMQEKNRDKTFTDIADSPRIRVYPRVEAESPHIRVYPREETESPRIRVYPKETESPHIRVYPRDQHTASSSNQTVSYIEDGSEMSIVHVVEDAPYTEIVIEDVPPQSRVEHSAFVPGYTEPVRFSQFPVYSSHASNSTLPSSIPMPPGSFGASSTPQSNVITSVFAPGMLGVPLNLVTLGSMPPGSIDQTSQEQYFHQEPQWRMPCP